MSNPSGSNAKLAIVAAVLVGLFAVVAINRYVRERTTVPETPKVCVLTASSEIPAGATLAEDQLTVAEIPAEGLSNLHVALPKRGEAGFEAALAEAKAKFVGHAAKRLIAANTPVFWIDVEEAPQAELTDLIGEDSRAVTLPVDTVSSVCGFIRPGSRVDIVLTATESRLGLPPQTPDGEDRVVSMVIMQNVPVIATDRAFRLGEEAEGYGTITLNVPTRAALTLVQARTMGTLTYLLRNVRDDRVEGDRARNVVYPGAAFYETVRALGAAGKEDAR